MIRAVAAIRYAGVVAVLASVLAGCAAPGGTDELPSPTPSATVTAAIAATADEVRTALGARGLQLSVPQVPFRPPEAAVLARAPRGVFQVKLPNDQAHGFFVIYELPSPAAAMAAAEQQVAYVQSGPGRVQFPDDAQFVLRQVGSTLVFYSWSPGAATDPQAPDIAAAIASVGTAYAIRA